MDEVIERRTYWAVESLKYPRNYRSAEWSHFAPDPAAGDLCSTLAEAEQDAWQSCVMDGRPAHVVEVEVIVRRLASHDAE